ncbi:MAG: cytoplasmic protein [Gemmatimonadales bacterium]
MDPTLTNPDLYKVVFENDRVRVLEYLDKPGDRTAPHEHPDSVMVTLSNITRRISSGGRAVDVNLPAEQARWLDAQERAGENTGDSETHAIFIELKEPRDKGRFRPSHDAGPPLGRVVASWPTN